MDPIFGWYSLNGYGRPARKKKFVSNGAWFEYKNTAGTEGLKSKGPLRKQLDIMVHFVSIFIEYRPNKFKSFSIVSYILCV